MCGIVGLFSKSAAVEERLGEHLGEMLGQMSDRGPDSAGVAVYRDPAPSGSSKLTLFSADSLQDWEAVGSELRSRGLETLPPNLLDATEELEGDDVLRAALGRGRDEDYVDYFIRVKRDEWARYHEQVTPWEVREYLTRF